MQSTTTLVSGMQKGESGQATWHLKNWKECHKFLAAHCSCVIKIGPVILRFFLRPLEKTFERKGEEIVTLKFYSLWTEVLSEHSQLFLSVNTILSHSIEEDNDNDERTDSFDSQVVLNRSSSDDNAILLVQKQFIFMETSSINLAQLQFYYNAIRRHNEHVIRATEVNLDITVTLYQPIESGKNGNNSAFNGIPLAEKAKTTIAKDLAAIFDESESKSFYDVQLKMKDDVVLPAHRYILSARSPVFRAMFSSDMKESACKVVDIPDLGSGAMKFLLNYMYTDRITQNWMENVSELVQGASKYNLQALLDHFDKNIINVCNINNAMELYRVAKLYSLEKAMKNLMEFTQRYSAQMLLCMEEY